MARSTRSSLKLPAQSPLPSPQRAASETSELTQFTKMEDGTAAKLPVAIDPVLLALRRPTTTNYSDFWFCPPKKWQAWLREAMAKEPQPKKTARNNLNKYSVAGRIMETDEGMVAPNPCYWCTRKSYDMVCMVLNKENETVCAYCKRHGKGGCTAGKIEDTSASDDAGDSGEMWKQVSALEDMVSENLQEVHGLLQDNHAMLQDSHAALQNDYQALEEGHRKLQRQRR